MEIKGEQGIHLTSWRIKNPDPADWGVRMRGDASLYDCVQLAGGQRWYRRCIARRNQALN